MCTNRPCPHSPHHPVLTLGLAVGFIPLTRGALISTRPEGVGQGGAGGREGPLGRQHTRGGWLAGGHPEAASHP